MTDGVDLFAETLAIKDAPSDMSHRLLADPVLRLTERLPGTWFEASRPRWTT